jgi:nucleotide-binding universal stress UspA family protein
MNVVVVGVSGSQRRSAAFERALLQSTPTSTIHVVSSGAAVSTAGAEALFESLAARCRAANRQCRFRLLDSQSDRSNRARVAESLCIAAQSVGADEVVIGHHALGALDKMLLGSVTAYAVEFCPLTVTVVKSNQ